MSTIEPVATPVRSEPPPHEPRRRRRTALLALAAVAVAVAAVAAAGGGLYLQQHGRADDARSALRTSQRSLDAAHRALHSVTAQNRTLGARVERLTADIDSARHGATHRIAQLEAELAAMAGPALTDGRYFGRLYAFGGTQDPPKLVIDLEQFFTGAAADRAAHEDGVLPPSEAHIPNDIYTRNVNPLWRILEVDPGATVSLVTFPGSGDPSSPAQFDVPRFGKIWEENKSDIVDKVPYWITVRDGTVTAIEEQFIP